MARTPVAVPRALLVSVTAVTRRDIAKVRTTALVSVSVAVAAPLDPRFPICAMVVIDTVARIATGRSYGQPFRALIADAPTRQTVAVIKAVIARDASAVAEEASVDVFVAIVRGALVVVVAQAVVRAVATALVAFAEVGPAATAAAVAVANALCSLVGVPRGVAVANRGKGLPT